MKRMRLRLPSKDDWWRYFDPNIVDGGIFCPTSEPPEVGREVRVEIAFVKGPRFYVRGTVMWRRPQLNDPRARAGVGIKVAVTDRGKLSYINGWVRGGMMDKRDVRRLPVRLRVTYSARSGRRINFTRDVSEEGVFVRSRELLDIKTPIQLVLAPPHEDYKPVSLRGFVARLVDDNEERGMGIRLEFESDAAREKFASFVKRLEAQYLAGELPDEVVS